MYNPYYITRTIRPRDKEINSVAHTFGEFRECIIVTYDRLQFANFMQNDTIRDYISYRNCNGIISLECRINVSVKFVQSFTRAVQFLTTH